MPPDPRDYEIRIWYSTAEGDECFVAQVVEWPGIMAHGETREEAARQIQLALEAPSKSRPRKASNHPRQRWRMLHENQLRPGSGHVEHHLPRNHGHDQTFGRRGLLLIIRRGGRRTASGLEILDAQKRFGDPTPCVASN
jgi:predicted RNase H-like HicB family nuclease